MSRGTKFLAHAAISHAKPKNARKDKASGKEQRCRSDAHSEYYRVTAENFAAVLPRFVAGRNPKVPVCAPMSQRKIDIAMRRLIGKD